MRVLIVSTQQAFRQQLQVACLRYPRSTISLRIAESIGQGLEFAQQFEAQVVFIDLTKNLEAGLLAIEELSATENRLVVSSNDKMSTEIVTRMVRSGSREILSQPVVEDEVDFILDKANALILKGGQLQPLRSGKIVICFSSKGGVGKTTMACNISMLLNQRLGAGNVCLVDANTQAPNISPMLDLRPERWLRDAVREYKRLDSELLKELMTTHTDSGLNVLAHSTENPLGLEFSEDQLDKILLVSKGTYQWTVVDTFPLMSTLNISMMDLADHILLVTEPIVPALRSARHNLDMLKKAGYGENRISVVLNKYTKFAGNVDAELVQDTLNWPIRKVINYDVHSTIAANTGRPLVTSYPDLPVTRSISELVDYLMGIETTTFAEENILDATVRRIRNLLQL
jgi:pilus assembly protein CpaE